MKRGYMKARCLTEVGKNIVTSLKLSGDKQNQYQTQITHSNLLVLLFIRVR